MIHVGLESPEFQNYVVPNYMAARSGITLVPDLATTDPIIQGKWVET